MINSFFYIIIDVDECSNSSLNNCHVNASCDNYIGSFNCSCNDGFEGDGIFCDDIDECQVNTSECHEHGNCHNIVGSYDCSCSPGYEGNGFECSGASMYA